MTTYEMEDLGSGRKNSQSVASKVEPTLNQSNGQDSAEQVWALAVAMIMAVVMIPLLFFPRFLVFLAGYNETALSPLERFLSNQLGVLLLTLAAGTIMATPDGTAISPDTSSGTTHPLLAPMAVGASVSAFIAWNTKGVGSLGTFVCVSNGAIGIWGFWALLFSGSGKVSKKTGADKHTSTYFFANKKAASVQKKEWKARQKEGEHLD